MKEYLSFLKRSSCALNVNDSSTSSDDESCCEDAEVSIDDVIENPEDSDTGNRKPTAKNDSSLCVEEELIGPRIYVLGCNNLKDKQVFDKKDCCYYCKKMILSVSFARHILNMHANEQQVQEIASMPKNSVKKRRACQLLRNLGNYVHNCDVLSKGEGHLIVVQRPLRTRDVTEKLHLYSACNKCFGYYTSPLLCRHQCPASVASGTKKRNQKKGLKLATIGMRSEIQIFFNRMKNDDVTKMAMEDDLIVRFISEQLTAKGMKKYFSVSEKVRLLVKLLTECRKKIDSKCTLSHVLVPSHLDLIKKIITEMFDYNCCTNNRDEIVTVKTPSTLIKLGQSLAQVAEVLRRYYLKSSDHERANETNTFIDILEPELRPMMTNAHLSLKSARSGLPEELPPENDMNQLKSYMNEVLSSYEKADRRTLKETALTFLMFFNKRRSKEVSSLTKDAWKDRNQWKKKAKIDLQNMTAEEKKLFDETDLVYVPGKCNQFVPILFPKFIIPAINFLASCGDTKYIFANNAAFAIRGNDALRNVALAAGIRQERISKLSSVKFRKQAASSLQVRLLLTYLSLFTCVFRR